MMLPPIPPDEEARLADLHRLQILDSPPEPAFDRITRMAAEFLRCPVAVISLVDKDRQWFKSVVGLDATEGPRAISFCGHAILGEKPMAVLNAATDERFFDNPVVTGDPEIRFYAGAPLKRAGGSALGTLCVIDSYPRAEFTAAESAILTELAGIVSEHMEQRLANREREQERLEREKSESLYRELQDSVRRAQSMFIAGANMQSAFEGLLSKFLEFAGGRAGCIVEVMPEYEPDPIRICAGQAGIALSILLAKARELREPVLEGPCAALPAMQGDEVVGVIGLEGAGDALPEELPAQAELFLATMAGLFSAARARRERAQNLLAINLRDRALASISSAVSIIDPHGNILHCNAAFLAAFECCVGESSCRSLHSIFGPETDPWHIGAVDRALRGDEEFQITLRCYHRDGLPFWNRLKLSPVKDKDGNVEYFVTVGDDVTEEIHSQEELRRAKERAEANAEAQRRFMANMSHEIRTPMNAVIGMTSLLLDSRLSAEQRDYVDTIRYSGEGLLALINEILDYSKIDSGALSLEKIEFDLRPCIEGAMDLVAGAAARKSIDLAYIIDQGVPHTILGDHTRLRQVLVNLVGNAVKFTPEGSVLVSVAGSRMTDANWDLHFAVEDTGIGIAQSKIEQIFKPFEQADSSSTRRFGGTGLGLSISKHLTELMGGKMWVESEPGQGSTFHFTIAAQALGRDEPAGNTEIAALNGVRVLVIDPNTASQSVLHQHLHSWGVEASVFSSVAEMENAMESAQLEGDFDAAIVDNDLPGLPRGDFGTAADSVPLIVLCPLGRRNTGLAAQLRAAGFERIQLHSKPIKPALLSAALLRALSGQPLLGVNKPQPQTFDPDLAARLPHRILLVEDNSVNQKLGLLLLSKLGYRADSASNGSEALKALERQPYDVLFMDMHMPEMDRLETTRAIHQRWDETRRPWIVALTANAMSTDRAACLEAGMQDFLTKPVQLTDLQDAILRMSAKRPTVPASNGAASAPNGASSAPKEWAPPDYLAELIREDPAISGEVIGLFRVDARKHLDALEAAILEEQPSKAKKILHSMKGSFVQMEANAIGELCARLEQEAENNGPAHLSAHLPELKARFEELLAGIENYLSSNSTSEP
jgi:PAS domain S-box-containing protein